jgi:antitoxin component YwqK of YwqJK toxin-antitoxin module
MRIFSVLLIFAFGCSYYHEKVIERWPNDEMKVAKIFYLEQDSNKYILKNFSPQGDLIESSYYIGKIKDGWSVTYYQNEKPKDSIYFSNGKPVASTRSFYANGKLKLEGAYDENGAKDGVWKNYDSLNKLTSQTLFVSGSDVGPTTSFDSNGRMVNRIRRYSAAFLAEEEHFKDGVLHGSFKKYSLNGNLLIAGEYNDGKKHGSWTEYYVNGNKFKELVCEKVGCKTMNAWDENGYQTLTNGKGKVVWFDYCPNRVKSIAYSQVIENGEIVDFIEAKLNSCK